MRKFYLSLFAFLLVFAAQAQSVLIDPTGDGGFENGATFAANGWTVANGSAVNQWVVGSGPTLFPGTNSAYVSNDGSTHAYSISPQASASIVHFYRDITFPAGETNVELSFQWYGAGEGTATFFDFFQVSIAPTTVTPAVVTNFTGGESSMMNPIVAGATVLLGDNLKAGAVQNVTICIPQSVLNNATQAVTMRLIFTWRNDQSVGTQPPAAVDNISLVSSGPPSAPAQPTGLALVATSISQIDGSFTGVAGAAGYLVVRYPAGATPTAPVDNNAYPVGSTLGSGVVIANGAGTTFSADQLVPNTTYDFYVYAYSGNLCAGPIYSALPPLTGSQTTQACTLLPAGTYTVGPTGNYTTLGAAMNALTSGVAGNVIFELQPTYTSAGETFPITIAETPCQFMGTVVVRPAAGATNLVITSSAEATIDFNGGDYVTFDGRPGGVGTAKQLSIINTSASGVAIRFRNDAQQNTITWCDVQGQNTSTTSSATTASGVIYFGGSSKPNAQGNDLNTISFCDVHATGSGNPAIAISARGENNTETAYNDSITITDNNIYDFFIAGSASTGLKADAGNNAWTVTNNSFYQTAPRTTSASNTHRAIWITPNTASIANTASGFIVTGNYVGGSAPQAGGTPWTMTGAFANVLQALDISVGLGTPTLVQGNTLSNIAVSTTSGNGFIGIGQANGHVDIINNTIGSQTNVDDIVITTTATGGGTTSGIRTGGGTGAVINIVNNKIGGITTAGTATVGVLLRGILVAGGTTINVRDNIVGSPTVANSMNASAATTGNSQSVIGIAVTTATNTEITDNTIANLNNNYIGTSTTGQTVGITVSTSGTLISGNTIFNLSNANRGTGSGSSSAVLGISMTSTASGATVKNNIIHSLSLTATTTVAGQITGLFFNGSASSAGVVDGNFIHSFDVTAANNSALMTGIDYAGGTGTVSNNMIRLGIKADGSSVTNAQVIRGITSNSSSVVNNFYHNSVYIGGTGVGTSTNNTLAFGRTTTSGTYDIRNNIFVNVRSNATTGGKHYAVSFTTNTNGVSMDYNIYRYNGTGGVFANNGSGDVATYSAGWLATDLHSFDNDPMFVNPTGGASAVNLHLQTGSIAEGTGIAGLPVNEDFDGQVRSGLSPVDIGADAGDFGVAGVDVGAIALVEPSAGGCGSPTQTVVVRIKNYSTNTLDLAINNVTVNVSATGPSAYASNITISSGTLAPGATLDVTLPATINTTAPGAYVFNASTSATGDGNPVNDAMGQTTYTLGAGASLSGTYTVGAGGNFATLTAAVDAYNNASCLAGNVVFELIDPSYTPATGETFPISIEENPSSAMYTLTIRPAAGNAATITGTSGTTAAALIKLNGTRNVIIDGVNAGGASLTISNTSTTGGTAAIWIASKGAGAGATNNVIRNLTAAAGVTQNNSTTVTYGIVMAGNALNATITSVTAGDDNDNNIIEGNTVIRARYGIYVRGGSAANPGQGNIIRNNIVGPAAFGADQIGRAGIVVRDETGIQIVGNEVRFVGGTFTTTTGGADRAGIAITTDATWAITAPTNVYMTNSLITDNIIHDIVEERTFACVGIILAAVDGVNPTNNLIANNMLYNVRSNGTAGDQAVGIAINAGNAEKIVYNTIYMTGDVDPDPGSTATSTSAFGISVGSTSVLNLQIANNLVHMDLQSSSSPTIRNSAINIPTGFAWGTGGSNNNDLYVDPAKTHLHVGTIGGNGGTYFATLAAWQTGSGQDAASVSVAPNFVSPTDLHLIPGLNINLNARGVPVTGVTTDIDGEARDAATPDIGADEFAPPAGVDATPTALVAPVQQTCYSNAEVVTVRIKNFSGNPLNFASTPVTVSVNVTGAVTQTLSAVVNTGSLTPGDSLDVTLVGTLDMTAIGTYNFEAITSSPADVNTSNDTLSPIVRVAIAPDAGTVTASVPYICLSGTPSLTVNGTQGGIIQWQEAPDPSGPWTNVGTAANTYTPAAAITDTMYYRVIVSCNANADTSTVTPVNVDNPQLVSTTPGTRCGPGTVTLTATGNGAATFNWYTTATGGTPVGTGASFTTPIINTTTTYYVAASNGGLSQQSVGAASVNSFPNAGTNASFTAGMLFDVLAPSVTIKSVDIYPTSPVGTNFKIVVRSGGGTGTVIATYQGVTTVSGSTASPVVQTVPVNFTIPAGTNYAMTFFDGAMAPPLTGTAVYPNALRNNPSTGATFPYTLPGLISITNGTLANVWYYFYNWQIGDGCESPRQAVVATVNASPAVDITNNLTVCNNAITTLQVNSALSDFDDYQWSPANGLFTDAAATVPYTAGTSASTVYAKIGTAGTYMFTLTANNTTTMCQNYDSVKVTVLPASITVNPSPSQMCVSGTSTITITPNPNTFGAATYQWMSSPDNNTYTNIAGATASSYTTPNITATTFYKVEVKNSAGAVCLSAYDTIEVNAPQILTTTPAALCGPGAMTLSATATPGSTIQWYSAANGGTLVGTGSTFNTPNLTQTTTYYAAALNGGSTHITGITQSQLSFGLCGAETSTTTTGWALRFTTASAVVINSAYVRPQSAGTMIVELHQNPSTGAIATANITISPSDVGQLIPINLGFTISTPGDYQMAITQGGSTRITTLGCGYPMSTPTGSFVITGSATNVSAANSTTTYNTFYHISVTEGCESPRVPVTAQVSNNTAILSQPANIATCVGATAHLVVQADGAQLNYQWRKNGANIPGATNDTLTFSPVALSDAGTYDVVITGLCGNVTSQSVTVNVSAANTWVGTVSSDWNTAANWCGGVPTPTSDVEIFPGTPFQPVINATMGNVRNLTLSAGATLDIMPSGSLSIYGDFVNNGAFVAPNGFVFFKGSTNQNIGQMTVGTVVMNNTGDGITLTGNMTVDQALVLTNGNITLGVNSLTINGSVNGALNSHIVTNGAGSVTTRNVNVTPVTVPVGPSATSFNPVIISSGSGRDYSVKVQEGLIPAINNPGLAVNRTWTITHSGATPTNVNITFQYDDTHMNTPGVPTNKMEVGVYNGGWSVVSPAGGMTPSGPSTARRVSTLTSQFGPMVVTNIGGVSWITSAPNVDPSVTSIQLLPNLVESNSILRVLSTRATRLGIQVVDGAGRVVMTLNKQVMVGQNDFPLELSHLAAGVYYLAGQTDKGKITVVRFVKM